MNDAVIAALRRFERNFRRWVLLCVALQAVLVIAADIGLHRIGML